jgi:hypothetical protein
VESGIGKFVGRWAFSCLEISGQYQLAALGNEHELRICVSSFKHTLPERIEHESVKCFTDGFRDLDTPIVGFTRRIDVRQWEISLV